MRNLIFWIVFYTLILASSQILLKVGTSQLGSFNVKGIGDIFPLLLVIIRNPMIILGTVLMASSFFLWLYILSWFKIGQVFPMTALVYVFVALMSYFLLGERLSMGHYFGVALVTAGIVFLLYK